MPAPKFEVIEEGSSDPDTPIDLEKVIAGLKALPQKTAVALSNCFALLTVATMFCLALLIVPYQPSIYQLVGLGGYAVFVIALNMIVRRK